LGKSWFTDEMLDRKYGLVDYFLEAIGWMQLFWDS
jgi:hypothetical protein